MAGSSSWTDFGAEAERIRQRDQETRAGWPTSHSMVVQLCEALGMFAGAMPIPPERAWEEALVEARRLRESCRR